MNEQELDLKDLLQGASLATDIEDFVTAHLIVDCHDRLGEGILYDDRQHAVLWSDIYGKRIHKLQLTYAAAKSEEKVRIRTYELPKQLCSFGLLENGSGGGGDGGDQGGLPLLCAWEDGFQLYDVEKGCELSEMSSGEDVNPDKGPTRLNDGRTDPAGKFYICGGFYGDSPGYKMKVFKVEQSSEGKLSHHAIVQGVEVTNSINWSLDGNTMYLADSPTKSIFRYDYNPADGTVSNKTDFHKKRESDDGVPDGSCVDSEGFLWNAVWRAGRGPGMVQRIHPETGLVVFTVHVPDTTSQLTCCCFGGENLDILFISTACEGRDPKKEPHAGGLYAVKLPFQGRKENRLKFSISA